MQSVDLCELYSYCYVGHVFLACYTTPHPPGPPRQTCNNSGPNKLHERSQETKSTPHVLPYICTWSKRH
jgi:hypothetical protein